jgi:proline iminopeptidase
MMGKPLYEPGMVRDGKKEVGSLEPPDQPEEDEWWVMPDDIQLYHFAEGRGRNVVVVHGGPGYPYRRPWAGLASLADRYRFHYYDQRGCGRSSRPFDRFESTNTWRNIQQLEPKLGIGAQVADLERIRRILGDEQLILIGSSFGGLLATLYAVEFSARVEKMILVAPADLLVMPSPFGSLYDLVGERLPAEMQEAFEAYMADYFDFGGIFNKSEEELSAINWAFTRFYKAAYAAGAPGQADENALKSIPQQGKAGGWMVQAQYFSLGKQHNYQKAVSNINAPVLVVHGAGDLQPLEASREYANAFNNGRFEVVQGAGHFVAEEQPEAFAALLGDWLGTES